MLVIACPCRCNHAETHAGCSHPSNRNPHREAIKYRLDGSPLIGPEKRKKKAIRTKNCLSDSEFFSFRFFLSIAGSGRSSGSPFLWLLSFGEAKESDSPSGETGVARTDGVHSTLPLTLTLSHEGRGDRTALRTDYALDSRFARMTADGWKADYAAS